MLEFQCHAYGVNPDLDGICYLLSIRNHHILLDCGLKSPFELLLDLQNLTNPLDCIFCSHAHLDHMSTLLKVHEAYPDVPIIVSPTTAKLLSFYEDTDKRSFQDALIQLPWRSPFAITPQITFELLPAGHIPGASACLIDYSNDASGPAEESAETARILYTGDFCLSNSRLTDGLPLQSFRNLRPDFLLINATLGNEKSPNRRYQEHHLISQIEEQLTAKKNIGIVANPVGQAQEIILLLKTHPLFSKAEVTIWIGDTVAKACELFEKILAELPGRIKNFAKTQSLFLESRLVPRVEPVNLSKIEASNHLNILITSPESIEQIFYSKNPISWHILWPALEYESQEPFAGTQFPQMARNVMEMNQARPSPFSIERYELHQHADSLGTLQLIHNLRPKHIAFSHGDRDRLADICSLEELINRYHLHLPQAGKTLEILVATQQLRSEEPSLAEMILEGELIETDESIMIRLPNSLAKDNRWDAIADSGIVTVTWQGENLVIKGVSQRELNNVQWKSS